MNLTSSVLDALPPRSRDRVLRDLLDHHDPIVSGAAVRAVADARDRLVDEGPGKCRAFDGASCIAWAREGACPHVPEHRWLRRRPREGEWVSAVDLARSGGVR